MTLWNALFVALIVGIAYICVAALIAALRFRAWPLLVVSAGMGCLAASGFLLIGFSGLDRPFSDLDHPFSHLLLIAGVLLIYFYSDTFRQDMAQRGLDVPTILNPVRSPHPVQHTAAEPTDEALLARSLAYLDECRAPYHPEWLRRELIRDGVPKDRAVAIVASAKALLPQSTDALRDAHLHLRRLQPARREVAQAALIEQGVDPIIVETAVFQQFQKSLTRHQVQERPPIIPLVFFAFLFVREARFVARPSASCGYLAGAAVFLLLAFIPRTAGRWRLAGVVLGTVLFLASIVFAVIDWWVS